MQNHQEELNWLLEAGNPKDLTKTIQTVLFSYIFEQERNGLNDDFRSNVENCQLLLTFFENIKA